MRIGRVMQIIFGTLIGLPALIALASVPSAPPLQQQGRLFLGGFMLLFAGTIVGVLQFQVGTVDKATARIKASITDIAAKAFDQPARVMDDFEGNALLGAVGFLLVADSPKWPAAVGTWQTANLIVTSHASVAGRQLFEVYHVYSYVVIDMPRVGGRFALYEDALMARMLASQDSIIGDPAFDEAWIIDADAEVAKRVLTPAVRIRLEDLRSKVSNVSLQRGQGRMSVVTTPYGLAIRWPGDIDAPLAIFLRDVLFDMRTEMLALADG